VSLSNWPTADIPIATAPGTPPRPAAPPASTPPPFPVVAPAGAAPAPLKPIHMRAPGTVPEITPLTGKPEQHPGFKLGVSVALGVLVVVLGVGGFFVWKYVKSDKAPAAKPPAGTATTTPPAPTKSPEASPPTSAETPATPETVEGNRVKVTDLIAAAQKDEQARIDALARGEEPPEKTPFPRPGARNPARRDPNAPPVLTKAPDSVVPTPIAPGVTANIAAPAVSVHDASPEFRAFVANAKITGVFQGEGGRGRAFINGRITRTGDMVDFSLGIMFDSIDPERKMIIFKDRTGAIATRKY
jgi:hypothetical protein